MEAQVHNPPRMLSGQPLEETDPHAPQLGLAAEHEWAELEVVPDQHKLAGEREALNESGLHDLARLVTNRIIELYALDYRVTRAHSGGEKEKFLVHKLIDFLQVVQISPLEGNILYPLARVLSARSHPDYPLFVLRVHREEPVYDQV